MYLNYVYHSIFTRMFIFVLLVYLRNLFLENWIKCRFNIYEFQDVIFHRFHLFYKISSKLTNHTNTFDTNSHIIFPFDCPRNLRIFHIVAKVCLKFLEWNTVLHETISQLCKSTYFFNTKKTQCSRINAIFYYYYSMESNTL